MKIYLTSDLLFGRQKAAEDRGLESPDHMEELLVTQWNETVKPGDTVYHLGNFSWDPISAETAVPFLNGKIIFVLGPYDGHLPDVSLVKAGKHTVLASGVNILRNLPVKKAKRTDMVLSHWPLLDWPGKDDGVLHAHGGREKTDLAKARRFSVNCENWGMRPVDLEALVEFADGFSGRD